MAWTPVWRARLPCAAGHETLPLRARRNLVCEWSAMGDRRSDQPTPSNVPRPPAMHLYTVFVTQYHDSLLADGHHMTCHPHLTLSVTRASALVTSNYERSACS